MSELPEHPSGRYTEVITPAPKSSQRSRGFLVLLAVVLTFVTGWATGIYTWSEWSQSEKKAEEKMEIETTASEQVAPILQVFPQKQPTIRSATTLKPEKGEAAEIMKILNQPTLQSPSVFASPVSLSELTSLFEEGSYKIRLSEEALLPSALDARPILETLQQEVAYWRPVRFDDEAKKQLVDQWAIWRSVPVGGMIIDLRFFQDGNRFQGAADLAGLFLGPGQPLFSLEGMKFPQQVFLSDLQPLERNSDFPIVILTNRYTRGAAEVFACLLRKNAAALIVGEATAGEGGLYTESRLESGRSLRLATVRATISDGTTLLGVSLLPDMIVDMDITMEEQFFALAASRSIVETIVRPRFRKRRSDMEMIPDPLLDDNELVIPAVDERLAFSVDLIQALLVGR
ncbi:MAG: S41 family peptidase [Verrucomicrobiota bacterium]